MARGNGGDAAEQGSLAIEIPQQAMEMEIEYIPWDLIFPDPQQPRVDADAELKASIAAGGIRQAITVRPRPGAIGTYQIVDGERRWRGAEGVQGKVPCVVRLDMEDDFERVRTQLITNTGKELTPVEEARAMAQLMAARQCSVTELAQSLGKPVTTVSQRLNLMQLGPWLDLLQRGVVKYTHAAEVLLPYRGCPDAVHQAVISELQETINRLGEGAWESADEFDMDVTPLYKKRLYPISKRKDDPRPNFNTVTHDRDCVCGTITLKDYQGARKYCGNPEWWQPLEKAAKKEARAKEKASGTKSKQKATSVKLPFHVPADVVVLKGQEWDTPKGYARLVDTSGQWAVVSAHRVEADAFDPRGIEFPSDALAVQGRLLLVKEQHAVVKAARKAWTERWQARQDVLRTAFAAQLEKGARGIATPTVALDTLAALIWCADTGALNAVFEIADALGIDVASLVKASEKNYGWGDDRSDKRATALSEAARKLKPKDAVVLLSAIVTAVHKELTAPSVTLRAEQKAVAAQIVKSKHPWTTKAGAKTKALDVEEEEEIDEEDEEYDEDDA